MYAPKLTALLGGFALYGTVAALSVGVATGAPTQTNGATLYVCQDLGNPSSYRISVKGVYPMSQPDAFSKVIHINDGDHPGGPGPGGLIVHLKADDGHGTYGNEDIGYGFYPTTANTSEGYLQDGPGGLEYRREVVVPRPNFNEDYKQPGSNDDVDEIYALVTFRDGGGNQLQAVTQEISRNFEVSGICDGCCQ
jgi:hypothetical protein